MNAVVLYESMFGNTRQVAEAIASGIGRVADVTVVAVQLATPELVDGADLLVIGGPTHMHGLSRASSRRAAAEIAGKPESRLTFESGAEGRGLREWFAGAGRLAGQAAAFDTRLGRPAIFTGRASRGIGRLLRRGGAQLVTAPESFLVTKDNVLVTGELERARRWGEQLAGALEHSASTGVSG